MNNKKLGTAFEREVCEVLAAEGYWVHFITPDARGAQPFDIIAVRDGSAVAIDCKTCVADTFSIKRLEFNQIFAFERWLRCGNDMPWIMIKHDGQIYKITYDLIRIDQSVKLREEMLYEGCGCGSGKKSPE